MEENEKNRMHSKGKQKMERKMICFIPEVCTEHENEAPVFMGLFASIYYIFELDK